MACPEYKEDYNIREDIRENIQEVDVLKLNKPYRRELFRLRFNGELDIYPNLNNVAEMAQLMIILNHDRVKFEQSGGQSLFTLPKDEMKMMESAFKEMRRIAFVVESDQKWQKNISAWCRAFKVEFRGVASNMDVFKTVIGTQLNGEVTDVVIGDPHDETAQKIADIVMKKFPGIQIISLSKKPIKGADQIVHKDLGIETMRSFKKIFVYE